MSGILRLANSGAGTGRSTLQSNASVDVTFSLPDTGNDGSALILTDDMHQISSVNWSGIDVNISNGDLNVHSGTLFVDESTARVGIGTTSPSALLTLVGNNTTRLELNDSNTSNSLYLEQSSTESRLQCNASQNLILSSQLDGTSSAAIELHTRNQARLFVGSGGSIGIGTVTPAVKLDVFSATSGTLIRATTSGSGTNLELVDQNATSQIRQSDSLMRIRCDLNNEYPNSKLRLEVDNQTCLIAHDSQTIGIGDGATTTINSIDTFLQVNKNSNRVGITLSSWTNSSTGPRVVFGKSRSGAVNTYTRVNTSDILGAVEWYGCDGTNLDTLTSQIVSLATNSAGTVRSNLKFGVTGLNGFDNSALLLTDRAELSLNKGGTTTSTDMISVGNHSGSSTTARYVCIRGTDYEEATSVTGYSLVNWGGADGAVRTTNNVYAFRGQNYTAGAGQTITAYQVFSASNTDVALSNFGFYGGIARSANNNYNVYSNGTANNFMRNCLVLGDTPSPDYPDKLIVLEDSRASYGNNNPTILFRGSFNGAAQNNPIGTIEFYNKDQSEPGEGVQANIQAKTANSNGAGAYLNFSTCGGSSTDTVRSVMRITQSGNIQLLEDGKAIILKSPDGTNYYIRVANGGTLEVTTS